MEPIPPCLAELESSARANLHAYLRRELASEYQAKHRNKASKIPAASLRELRISGEQLQAYVDESLHSYRVDMSFPFFDLEADFTLIKCSCMREALSFEPQRCHHMYRVQDYVANLLDRLSQMEVQDGPLASLLELVSSPSQDTDHETWLLETRWILLWDAASSELSLEHATRSLYGKAATWQVQGRWPSKDALPILQNLGDPVARKLCETLRRAAQSADSEIFELLGLARDDATVLIEEKGSRVSLRVENSTWQIFVSEEAEGYRLHIKLSTAQLSPTNVIKGQGLVAFDSEAQIIYLARLESPYAALVEGIMGQSRLIPKGDREAMLAFIEKLDPGIAVLWAESPIQATPVERMQTLLRLTPFQRGGMKLEIWLQLSPGTLVRAAQGLERIRERSYRGQLREFIRDFTLEQKLQRRVEHRLDLELLPEPEPGIFIAYNDELALGLMSRIELAKSELELLLEWPKAMLDKTQAYQVSSVIDGQSLRVSVTEKRDWFALEGWLEMDDGQKISLRELLLACRQEKRYVRLADGKWAVISDHFRQRLDPLVKNFEEDDGDCLLDLAVLGSNAEQAALEKFDFSSASQGFWRLVQQTKHARKIDAQLPTGLLAELRPYQLDGFKWLYHLAAAGLGACLADDMGLGKTLQALAVLLSYQQRGPSLVIAPSSLAYNWQAEAQRFCPSLKVVLLRELSDRGRERQFKAGELVIASYGLVMRYSEQLAVTRWNILVFDEAQHIKNAQTKTAQAVQTLTAEWRLALSGTPIENHLGELWSLFRTISPGLFGEWERFRRSYALPIERDQSLAARERLKRKLNPFILRRLKQDYLSELPPKTDIDLWVDLNDEEQSYYDALRGEAIDKIEALASDEDAKQKQKIQVLAALNKLRQAACHRVLLDAEWTRGATKIDLLREQVLALKAAGHSALVFSQFTRFLKLIDEDLASAGLRLLYLDGETPIPRRMELVREFQAGGIDVFLISLKAGGTGLNLTQASYVFHMDPWWNPAVEAQASDRAWRMGQRQAVTVYKMRARNTIEELIHSLHAEKRDLVESILEGRLPDARFNWDEVWHMFTQRPEVPRPKTRVQPMLQGDRLPLGGE